MLIFWLGVEFPLKALQITIITIKVFFNFLNYKKKKMHKVTEKKLNIKIKIIKNCTFKSKKNKISKNFTMKQAFRLPNSYIYTEHIDCRIEYIKHYE